MSGPLWSADELAAALGAPSAPPVSAIDGVSIDTRTLRPGDLFIAIKGEAQDGHSYVGKAFALGAGAAVIAAANAEALAGLGPIYVADDTLKAMQRLGGAARARSDARIAAVTGSVGKTSAKEMLRIALGALAPTHASAASYNNHWGVPLTLARMPRDARYGVFEIGMNHAGEIAALSPQVRPHAALVTTIAPVHIEHLGSLRGIAEAKAEIVGGLQPDGAAVLNRDAPDFDLLAARATAKGARVLAFGRGADADARLLRLDPLDGGSRISATLRGRALSFTLGAPCEHMAFNALGVLLAAEALGADVDGVAAALAGFTPQKGRGERSSLMVGDGAFTLIDESYNANPASMRAALTLLGDTKPGPGGRRIAVVGDRLELGADGAALHADLAPCLAKNWVELLFAAGPLSKALADNAPPSTRAHWGAKSSDIEAAVLDAVRPGDVVMVKGSNGSRMGPIVAAMRLRFCASEDGNRRC